MDQASEGDLVVALLHRERFADMIEEQEARIERFKQSGSNIESSKRLLELLQNSLRLLDDFIERQLTTAPQPGWSNPAESTTSEAAYGK